MMESSERRAVADIHRRFHEALDCIWTDRIEQAFQFAAEAHSQQQRVAVAGAEPAPYISHPATVAVLCAEWFSACALDPALREDVVVAALLHDTVEDCEVSLSTIEGRFGKRVAQYVWALSRPAMRSGESSDQRMRRFVQQIRDAGRAAVLIKLCDFVHNISALEQTPATVVARAVAKGGQYYLPLLSEMAGAPAFEQFVARSLEETRSWLQERKDPDVQQSMAERLAASLLRRDAKWDVHDAPRLFEQAFPGSAALVASISETGTPVTIAGSLDVRLDKGIWEQIQREAARHKGFAWLKAKWFRAGAGAKADERRYCVWTERAIYGTEFVIIARLPGGPLGADSLSPELVMRLVMGSVHRHNAELWRDLSIEANRLRMQIDMRVAMELGVQRGQLELLENWRKQCELACRVVQTEIGSELARRYDKRSLWHRVRVEQRVKTPDSILTKLRDDKRFYWPEFQAMQDVAGVRVVCPTMIHVEELTSWLETDGHPWRTAQPAVRYDLNPTKEGYRGVHLGVVLSAGGGPQVPCEIQIRTLLQDAWSTLSHKTAYKLASKAERKLTDDLRDLSRVFAECEAKISQILQAALSE